MNEITNNVDPKELKSVLDSYVLKQEWDWYNRTQKNEEPEVKKSVFKRRVKR